MTEFRPSGDKPVTRANFMQAPFNRWAFQNIRELQPTRELYRGDGPVSWLESIPQVLDELLFEGDEGRQINLHQWQQQACVGY
jgi:hypothetical protein